jgi:hypothetical protein
MKAVKEDIEYFNSSNSSLIFIESDIFKKNNKYFRSDYL